jgi:exonuclease SbcD
LDLAARDTETLFQEMERKLADDIESWLAEADPELPTILAAHATVEGAKYGGERSVALGKDFIVPLRIAADSRLDYSALGHIHKKQDLNPKGHPPVVYPGSIERVDFGEAADNKYFLIAEIEKGKTSLDWRELSDIRSFVDLHLTLESKENITDQIKEIMPADDQLVGAVARLTLEYPRAWEPLIDESSIRGLMKDTFEFHFHKEPVYEPRLRLPKDRTVGSLSPEELLDEYWRISGTPDEERKELNSLARDILHPDE